LTNSNSHVTLSSQSFDKQTPTCNIPDRSVGAQLTTFQRRQRILALLREQPGLRVAEMAEQLAVSEGTVRNDLNALAEARQLTRVRGGAVPADEPSFRSPAFAARARVNEAAKQTVARWAAELVEDEDSILLDASTTVYHMARFLVDRRHLTVVTNGIEVGRRVAQNPSHSVILLGGSLRDDGTAVSGPLSERSLRDFHVKTAFVSCSGFSLEAGLTEVDIDEAHLKSRMIGAADQVVALVDSTKFGRVDLTPFAQLHDVSRLFTDSDLAPSWVEALRRTSVVLTLCGDNPLEAEDGPVARSRGALVNQGERDDRH
jgi:DeoR/GlpR family transcriptional regulator of sugar metabolism